MAKKIPMAPEALRFSEYFPENSDVLMQVLRGHLLVEEVVNQLFELKLTVPKALKGNHGTSFQCHQVICLAEALSQTPENLEWVWISAKKLNSLRNKLAHNLPTESLSHSIEDFIETVQTGFYKEPHFLFKDLDSEYPLLRDSILCLYVGICRIKELSKFSVRT
ncbi:hypothetical protein ACODG7_16700 [Vibrio anguillarum]|nr:hypothetical protein [Vibrio anguillarum]OEE33239.1 hypothetical protein A1QW_10915 [Vibrio anguillarum]OEF92664.1 hypothetical protein A1QY_18070 [Vibrio anguillarum]